MIPADLVDILKGLLRVATSVALERVLVGSVLLAVTSSTVAAENRSPATEKQQAEQTKRPSGDDDPTAWTRRKIGIGARQFRSFRPLRDAWPRIDAADRWSRTVIDRFLADRLDPSPGRRADRRTLIRRAWFDLIGLPPAPRDIGQYLADEHPAAFDKRIDRLLANPHYGQRWGRHWLDVARYAESDGFEADFDRPGAYHYRDFVVQSLNQDMPYDRFVRWQLAGDELAPEVPAALMATGFLGAGVFPTQITEREFESARYDELDDMVSTMGTALLGMTVGCARCHDHKYDPIPQGDYYRLVSAFTTTIRSHLPVDLDPEGYQQAREEFDRRHAPLVASLTRYEDDVMAERFRDWLNDNAHSVPPAAKWRVLDFLSFKSTKGATLTKLYDGSILATGEKPKHDEFVLVAESSLRNITAVRLDALTHPTLVRGGPGRSDTGDFQLNTFYIDAQPLDDPDARPQRIKMAAARATYDNGTALSSARGAVDGSSQSAWSVGGGGIGSDQSIVFDLGRPIDFESGVRLTFKLFNQIKVQHALGCLRLSITGHPAPVAIDGTQRNQHAATALQVLAEGGGSAGLNDAQQRALRRRFFQQDARWRKLRKTVDDHALHQPWPRTATVLVSSEGVKPIPHDADQTGFPHFYPQTHFLRRGDTSQKQGVASQGFLQVLMRSPEAEQRWLEQPPGEWRTSYRRRSLAGWITDPEYGAGHLLARVMVNRLWQHHLGMGIVATPNDFGRQGEPPTHPELLDWLAVRLIEGGWRLKPLHRRIMTSAVYRQSPEFGSAPTLAGAASKPDGRFQPRRLEAEVIRDAMLAVSGQLDSGMYGRGTLEPSMRRRSIYFKIKRSRIIPMLQIFDMPDPVVSMGSRPTTTIAPQALLLINNPQVRHYAKSFVRRLQSTDAKSPGEVVERGYWMALGRPPTRVELRANAAFIESQAVSYITDGEDDARNLALADFCQVLMCMNEFIYVQ